MKDLVESTNNSCAEMRVRAQIHGNELSTFSADIQTTNVDQLNGIHVRTKEFCIESQHELNKFGNDLTKQKETLQANKTTLESTVSKISKFFDFSYSCVKFNLTVSNNSATSERVLFISII